MIFFKEFPLHLKMRMKFRKAVVSVLRPYREARIAKTNCILIKTRKLKWKDIQKKK
jgi:hypothetical protein